MPMTPIQKPKRKKTFPLEIEENLHKMLKFKALESDMTLHAYILETLNAKVREDPPTYLPKTTNSKSSPGESS